MSKDAKKPFDLGHMKKLEMNDLNLRSERIQIQRIVWNGPQSILILTNNRIATIEVNLDERSIFTGNVYPLDGLSNPYKCEMTPTEEWAVCTALSDSDALQEVRTNF